MLTIIAKRQDERPSVFKFRVHKMRVLFFFIQKKKAAPALHAHQAADQLDSAAKINGLCPASLLGQHKSADHRCVIAVSRTY